MELMDILRSLIGESETEGLRLDYELNDIMED